MPGEGRHTIYAPTATPAHTFLNKVFKSRDPIVKPPTQDLIGKEDEARAAVLKIAIEYLQPRHQAGDPGLWPTGVDLDFSGASVVDEKLRNAPDFEAGADNLWTQPGDPANSFVPDITSPGPGKTQGRDKDVDPQISSADINPKVVVGSPDTGTQSPSVTTEKLFDANVLGKPGKLGKST